MIDVGSLANDACMNGVNVVLCFEGCVQTAKDSCTFRIVLLTFTPYKHARAGKYDLGLSYTSQRQALSLFIASETGPVGDHHVNDAHVHFVALRGVRCCHLHTLRLLLSDSAFLNQLV